MKLGYQFQMENVLNKCEQFLINSEDVPVIKKLIFAGQYYLAELEDVCVKKLTTIGQVQKLKKEKEFQNLTNKTKVAMLEKMLKLTKHIT